jgi:DNA primase
VKAMRRHVDKVIVNFDGDTAGENAAEKSIQILLEEGVQIRVCSLPGGQDPDEFAKQHGAEAYRERLEKSPGYFYWLAQRARTRFDMKNVEGRMEAFRFLLPAIQKLPDKLERLAVVNDVARELGVEPGAVLEQFRKNVGDGGRRAAPKIPDGGLPDREKLLIRLMLHHPEVMRNYVDTILGMEALGSMKGRKFLEVGLTMLEETGAVDFQGLQGRLSEAEANLLPALFSSDTEGVEKSNDNPAVLIQSCLASLQSDYYEGQLKDLRQRVAEAERRGDVGEAMELMRQADQAERRLKTYRLKS